MNSSSTTANKCSRNCSSGKEGPPKAIEVLKHYQANLTDSSRSSTADTATDPTTITQSIMCDSPDDEDLLDDHVMCTTNYEETSHKSSSGCGVQKTPRTNNVTANATQVDIPSCMHGHAKCPRTECARNLNKDREPGPRPPQNTPVHCARLACRQKHNTGTQPGPEGPRVPIKLNITSTDGIQPHIQNLSCRNLSCLEDASKTAARAAGPPVSTSRTSGVPSCPSATTGLPNKLSCIMSPPILPPDERVAKYAGCVGQNCGLSACANMKCQPAECKPCMDKVPKSSSSCKGDPCNIGKCREALETTLRLTLKSACKKGDDGVNLDTAVVSNSYVARLKDEIQNNKTDYEITSSGCVNLKDIKAEIFRYRKLLKTSNNVIEQLPPGASSEDIKNNISEFLKACEVCEEKPEVKSQLPPVAVDESYASKPSARESLTKSLDQPPSTRPPVLTPQPSQPNPPAQPPSKISCPGRESCPSAAPGTFLTEQQLNIKKVEDLVLHAETALQRIRQELELEQNKQKAAPIALGQCSTCSTDELPQQKPATKSNVSTKKTSSIAEPFVQVPPAKSGPPSGVEPVILDEDESTISDSIDLEARGEKPDGVEILYEKGLYPKTSSDKRDFARTSSQLGLQLEDPKNEFDYESMVTNEPVKTVPSQKYMNITSMSRTVLEIIPSRSKTRIMERFDPSKEIKVTRSQQHVVLPPPQKKRRPNLSVQKLPEINIRCAPLVIQKLTDVNITSSQPDAPALPDTDSNIKYEEVKHQCLDQLDAESCHSCSQKDDDPELHRISSKKILELLKGVESNDDRGIVFKSYQVLNELKTALLACTELEQEDIARITELIDEDVYKTFVDPQGKRSHASTSSLGKVDPSQTKVETIPEAHPPKPGPPPVVPPVVPHVVPVVPSAETKVESVSEAATSGTGPSDVLAIHMPLTSQSDLPPEAAPPDKEDAAMLSMLSRISNYTSESSKTPSQLQFVATEGTQCDMDCRETCAARKRTPEVCKKKVTQKRVLAKVSEGAPGYQRKVGSQTPNGGDEDNISMVEQIDEGIQISLSYSDDISSKGTQTDFGDAPGEHDDTSQADSMQEYALQKRVSIKIPEPISIYEALTKKEAKKDAKTAQDSVQAFFKPNTDIIEKIKSAAATKGEKKSQGVGESTLEDVDEDDDDVISRISDDADSGGSPSKGVTIMSVMIEQDAHMEDIYSNKSYGKDTEQIFPHNTPAGDSSPILELFTKRMFQEVGHEMPASCYTQFEQVRDLKNSCAKILKRKTCAEVSESSTGSLGSLSDGEVRCKCSVSVGEIHVCKYAKQAHHYKKNAEKMLQYELANKNLQIKKQKAKNDNWISYYVSEDQNVVFKDKT